MNLTLSIGAGDDLTLDPERVRIATRVERIGDIRDRFIAEIDRLPRDDTGGVDTSFMTGLLRDSLRKGERLWLLPLDEDAEQALREWLPDGCPLIMLGPLQDRAGHRVTPNGVSPRRLVECLLTSSRPGDADQARHALEGIDGLKVPMAVQDHMQHRGIPHVSRGRVARLASNPKFLAYIVVLIYSALRVLPVTFVKEFHGSLLVLWCIDLGTAIPYTWGILAVVTAGKLRVRLAGLVTAIVTFVAPYVYFGAHGRDYPPTVIAVIAFLIASTFVLEVAKYGMDRWVARSLRRRALR
ncbi:MAG: hypothetical protein Q4B10_01605 [Actinomycetaceae bacterium]|nr:hypothetical protein [Actinomycetaceae bacterium]